MPAVNIQISTQFQGTGSAAAKVALGQVGQEASKSEKQLLAYAQATAAAQRQQGDAAGAVRTLTAALNQVTTGSKQAVVAEGQLASALSSMEKQAKGAASGLAVLPRTLESFGTGAIDQFKSSLLGIVGPAAVATTAMSALVAVAHSFEEGFKLKATLDQTTNAITVQLQGVRNSSEVFAQATAFADKYKLTQQEVNAALQASVGILRTSTSSADDLLGVLARLQVASPEQGLEGAALAVKELSTGSINSLVTRFEVSRTAANKMKEEIAGGADAVQVLSKYLTDAGIGAESLEARTKGAAGALNDAKKAAEDVAIAQGKLAESAGGILVVKEIAQVYRGLANVLNGDVVGGLKATAASAVANQAAQQAYNQAIAAGKNESQAAAIQQAAYDQVLRATYTDFGLYTPAQDQATVATNNHTRALGVSKDALSEEALKKIDDQIATAGLSQQQTQLAADSARAAQGLLGAGDQALILAKKYGLAADQAQFLIQQQQKLSNATALADQRVGERDPSNRLTAAQNNAFDKLADARRKEDADKAKADADKAKADAKQLRDAQNGLNLARATTKEQKIAELQRQQKATADPVEKLRLQTQIEQEKRSGAGRVGAAKTTALQLNDIARTSGDDRLRIERENLERLRDQQEDFDVKSTRSREDYERQRRRLLAEGKRFEAAQLAETFNREQTRAKEDFDREKRRTLRNNAEALGDQTTKVENRVEAVNARAVAKGVAPSAVPGVAGAGDSTPLPAGTTASAQAAATRTIQLILNGQVNMDGKQVGMLVYDTVRQQLDIDLAAELIQAPQPGSGQTAVAGSRP
jgi:hypothetical protein